MKEMVRYGFTLAVICMAASGLLAGVNTVTKPRITAQATEEEMVSLKEVLPQAASFEPVKKEGAVYYYKGLDKYGKLIGVAFKAGGKGYSSDIEAMAGVLKDGSINVIKILSESETPGIGSRIRQGSFLSQFQTKKLPDLSKVQAITGATISSRAVINAVTKKLGAVLPEIKDGK